MSIDKRPYRDGVPVPYVARWTGMAAQQSPLGIRDNPWLEYADGGPEFRDDIGTLWMREGLIESGEPEFGQVSVYRQRASMRRALCQVCGDKLEGTITWLMGSDAQWEYMPESETVVTFNPPTCATCAEVAEVLCPHLSKLDQPVIFDVTKYEIVGVQGDLFTEHGWVKGACMPYTSAKIKLMIAKAQLVRFTEFTRRKV